MPLCATLFSVYSEFLPLCPTVPSVLIPLAYAAASAPFTATRVTHAATTSAATSNVPAKKYGAPGRYIFAFSAMTAENTCVNNSGPTIPFSARS